MNYSQDEKILIYLSSFEFMTPAKAYALLDLFNTPAKIYQAITQKNENAVRILSPHFEQIFQNCDEKYIDSFVKNLQSQNIICSTFISENYPKLLKETYQCPINLYLKGDISLLSKRCLAIVGTRNPSNYGKTVTYDFAKKLAKSGLVIVSGLAMGVDKISHEATLEAGGKTIAVLGAGFNYIYPAMNTNLAREIEKKGLLVSEYAPSIQPQKYTFPARNRIIAGLCEGVLLTEAGEKSGTIYTKEYAVDFNRNVYAVPGNINSVTSVGTNKLIKTCAAACVLDYRDILLDLNISDESAEKAVQLSVDEQIIMSYVEKGQIHYDELLNATKFEPKTLNSYLTYMAIRGIIKKLPGNYYSK